MRKKGLPHLTLADERLKELDNPSLTADERTLLRSRVAAELIHIGKYEDAREALGELWQGIGNRPNLRGLPTSVAAEVLLQCGVLSGWLGSMRSIPNAQENAKDLLTESLRKFQSQREQIKVSEVKYELGLCYFRLGAYDESRIVLEEAAKGLADNDTQLKAKVLIRRASVEIWASRHHDALRVLEEAQPFFEGCNDAIKGRWHGHMALALRRLASSERRADYVDRAIIEYTAAAYHFEQAQHESYRGRALNNLAFLLYKLGRHKEAHENIDRAAAIFTSLKDESSLAQVNETRVRVLVAEQRYREASRVISEVIKTFEKSGEVALLADAFTIQGVVWARLRSYDRSINILRHAMNLAQDSGALSSAGLAALAFIEEHGESRLSESELCNIYLRANTLLKNTQDAEEIVRLSTCSSIVVRRLSISHAKLGEENFSLPDVVLAYEGRLIEQALELEGGKLSHAAKRLGVTRQRLTHILKTRHRNLWHKRTPIKRHRSYSRVRAPRKTDNFTATRKAQPVSILVVEDDSIVADAIKEFLEHEGWCASVCSDGLTARSRLESDEPFNLLILDYQLAGETNGVELIQLARSLTRRQHTPIIMLSGSEIKSESLSAGADAFLKKPQDINVLVDTIKRLLIRPQR